MSSRIYPLYRKGNPQLRVFLPNFWMKLVKVEHRSLQPHQVNFIVSSEMTSIDVKNYLEKIYKVPVMDVRTANYTGEPHFHPKLQVLYKEKDYKMAFVTLPKDYKFDFPDVVSLSKKEERMEKSKDDVNQAKKTFDQQVKTHKQPGRKGLPSFFGL